MGRPGVPRRSGARGVGRCSGPGRRGRQIERQGLGPGALHASRGDGRRARGRLGRARFRARRLHRGPGAARRPAGAHADRARCPDGPGVRAARARQVRAQYQAQQAGAPRALRFLRHHDLVAAGRLRRAGVCVARGAGGGEPALQRPAHARSRSGRARRLAGDRHPGHVTGERARDPRASERPGWRRPRSPWRGRGRARPHRLRVGLRRRWRGAPGAAAAPGGLQGRHQHPAAARRRARLPARLLRGAGRAQSRFAARAHRGAGAHLGGAGAGAAQRLHRERGHRRGLRGDREPQASAARGACRRSGLAHLLRLAVVPARAPARTAVHRAARGGARRSRPLALQRDRDPGRQRGCARRRPGRWRDREAQGLGVARRRAAVPRRCRRAAHAQVGGALERARARGQAREEGRQGRGRGTQGRQGRQHRARGRAAPRVPAGHGVLGQPRPAPLPVVRLRRTARPGAAPGPHLPQVLARRRQRRGARARAAQALGLVVARDRAAPGGCGLRHRRAQRGRTRHHDGRAGQLPAVLALERPTP